MGKRGAGEGSIYQRRDGRWAGALSLERGRRKTYYGRTQEEVIAKMTQARRDLQQGTLITERDQKMEGYLKMWFAEVYGRGERPARYSTRYKVEGLLRNHILPALGPIWLQKLTARDVQRFYNQLIDDKRLAASSVRNIHNVLHQALDTAVQWGLLPRNVTDLVKKPALKQRQGVVLSTAQYQALMAAAKGTALEMLIRLAVFTGARSGELRALHWEDVDVARGLLHIRHTLMRVTGKGLVRSETKTEKSKRTIELPAPLLATLLAHQAAQTPPAVMLFPSREGGYLDRANMDAAWKRLLKKAGLPTTFRFHDLRHTASSLMQQAGVNPSVVQQILGHSNISTTLGIYTHVQQGQQLAAIERLWEVLGEH